MQKTFKLPNEPLVLAYTENKGHRLFSVLVSFPTVLLAELRTHRILVQGSAYEHSEIDTLNLSANSSRAIPIKTLIQNTRDCPYIPLWTGKQAGMVGAETTEAQKELYTQKHLEYMEKTIEFVEELLHLGVHKQDANRYLSPFSFTTCILTGTEWANFFNLRVSEHAQPAFNYIAQKIKYLYDTHTPKNDKFHIPFLETIQNLYSEQISDYVCQVGGTKNDYEIQTKYVEMQISASLCAKLSYDTHENIDTFEKHLERYNELVTNSHNEPFSHQAIAMDNRDYEHFYKAMIKHNSKIDRNNENAMYDLGVENVFVVEQGWSYNVRGFISFRYKIENL